MAVSERVTVLWHNAGELILSTMLPMLLISGFSLNKINFS